MKSNTSTSQKIGWTKLQKEKPTMQASDLLITLVFFAALLFASCAPRARVGELRSESQSVELQDSGPVHVQINFGAGDLKVTGGAADLLEADFTYNVAELKPEIEYTDGTLVLRQPGNEGLPDLRGITDFRNEWELHLTEDVPMDLSVDIGAGASDLQLAGLSLTGLDITLGAGGSTIDLSGGWASDLNVTIEAGAGDITVRLPRDIGARVKVDAGMGTIDAQGLTKDGNIYTNAAFGVSDVSLQINMQAGIGQINLEVDE